MELPVTKKDREKAKTTFTIFIALFVVFAILSSIAIINLPRAKTIKSIGANGENIRLLMDAKDGSFYFACSEKSIAVYNMATNEQISCLGFDEFLNVISTDDREKLLNNSLSDMSFEYFCSDNGNYVFACDSAGNIFRLNENDGYLTVSDDYLLAEKRWGHKRFIFDEKQLYKISSDQNNNMVLEKFDVEDISGGAKDFKYLWATNVEGSTFGTKSIELLKGDTAIYDACYDSTSIYIATERGIVKVDKSFNDYEEINYYNQTETAYLSELKAFLLNVSEEKRQPYDLTVESIEGLTKTQAEKYFSIFSKDSLADFKFDIASNFANDNDWCESYDALRQTLSIYDSYFDNEKYTIVYAGDYNIGGIVYSTKNRRFYFANRLDNVIYSSSIDDIKGLSLGGYISDVAQPIEYISFADKSFSTEYACIRYNKFANSLYVLFANIKTISIIDLNNTEEYKISYNLDVGFDIFGFSGDQNNAHLVTLRNQKVVDNKGKSNTFRYIDNINVTQYSNMAMITTFLVILLTLCTISLLLTIYFFIAFRSTKALFTHKKIKRDLMKNKWVYIALIPFIGLLIISCYYEAIGSIALSFFDYTAEKPAMKWNDFANYLIIFNQPDFWLSVKNTLFFLVFDIILCIIPPLIFAFMLSIIRVKKLSGVLRSLMFIPGIIPGIASMLIWRIGIFGDYGILNTIITASGGEAVQFLTNVTVSRWSLIFMGFPFVGGYLIFYGGIMNIPKEYYEACDIEGLNIFKRFITIDIPLIMPQIKYMLIMTIISSVQNYARTYMLKSSGTITIVENMYISMNSSTANYGIASAYATLLFIFLFLAVLANFKLQKKNAMGDSL